MKKFKRSIAAFLAMAMTVLLLTAGFATAEEASESVTVIFENTVLSEEDADGEIWTGSYTKEVKLQEGMKMSDAVVAAAKDQFGEDGITVDNSWGFFITAIGGLSSTSVKNAPAGAYPGFTGTLNDWFVDQTFDNFTVDAGDVIKVMFTITGMGEDVGNDTEGQDKATLKKLEANRGSLSPAFSAETKEYELTLPKNTEKIMLTAAAKKGGYQVRIYKNEYKPEDDYTSENCFESGNLIDVKDGDVLFVGVGDESWPGSAYYDDNWNELKPESYVYKITVKVSDEAAEIPDLEDIYKETGKDQLASTEPVYGNDLAVFTLARAGLLDDEAAKKYYDSVKALVEEKGAKLKDSASTENSKVILALTALGFDPTDVEGVNLLEPLADMEYVDQGMYSGPVYALLALDSAEYEIPATESGKQTTREALVDAVLAYQNEDGGFTWGAGGDTDIDTTAMVIPALAPYVEENEKAKKAVEDALDYLKSVQNADGSYASWGTVNSNTEASVAIALSSLKRDSQADEEFSKNGVGLLENLCLFYIGDGKFEYAKDGGANAYASYQSFQALVSYYLNEDGESFFKVKEAEKEEEPVVEPGGETEESDETGEGRVLTYVAILALASLMGMAVTRKQEEQ